MRLIRSKVIASLVFVASLLLLTIINFSVAFTPVVHFIALPLLLITILGLVIQAFRVD
jgi:hypothetical protein